MCGYATENNRDDTDADGDDYTELFYVITSAPQSHTSATRHEVHANLDIACADKLGVHDLKQQVDTGASGNTLPVRIAKQMYGEILRSKIEPVCAKCQADSLAAVKSTVVACRKLFVATRIVSGANISSTSYMSTDQPS